MSDSGESTSMTISRRKALGMGAAVIATAAAGPLLACGGGTSVPTGNIGTTTSSKAIVLPPDVFAASTTDPGVIDVQKLYGAKGDGVTDDTQALINAYNDVLARYQKNTDQQQEIYGSQSIIYLPAGTYRVTNTIIYSTPVIFNSYGSEELARIRFWGAGEGQTIIKLDDNLGGAFAAGMQTPVLSFAKELFNATEASNYVENLTIDVGSGNPGAVGLLFAGANNAAVRNVTIRSSDPAGAGAVGLWLPVAETQGVYTNLTIIGFDQGIVAEQPRGFGITVDTVQLQNQNRAAVTVVNAQMSANNLQISAGNAAMMGVQVTGADGSLVLISSTISSSAAGSTAIAVDAGQALLRDITTSGFGTAVTLAGTAAVKGPNVTEWVSSGPETIFNIASPQTLGLPIMPTPSVAWPTDLSLWVNVQSYGAVGDGKTDDSVAIQKAVNAAATGSIVYFPSGPNGSSYYINNTITIPSNVKAIVFFFTGFIGGSGLSSSTGIFSVEGNSTDSPLFFEDIFSDLYTGNNFAPVLVLHSSSRPVVMKDIFLNSTPLYANTVPGGDVFLENVRSGAITQNSTSPNQSLSGITFTGQQVWVRYLNVEYRNPDVINDGSKLWLLGIKSEGPGVLLVTKNGGSTELLGAEINVFTGGATIPATQPIISNQDSNVSASFATMGPTSQYFQTIVSETQNGTSGSIQYTQLPQRPTIQGLPSYDINKNQVFLPLYVGRVP